jgi:hypothetical protein
MVVKSHEVARVGVAPAVRVVRVLRILAFGAIDIAVGKSGWGKRTRSILHRAGLNR